jgi:hypothetical protein
MTKGLESAQMHVPGEVRWIRCSEHEGPLSCFLVRSMDFRKKHMETLSVGRSKHGPLSDTSLNLVFVLSGRSTYVVLESMFLEIKGVRV